MPRSGLWKQGPIQPESHNPFMLVVLVKEHVLLHTLKARPSTTMSSNVSSRTLGIFRDLQLMCMGLDVLLVLNPVS